MRRWASLLLLALLSAAPSPGPAAPRRVVSISPCVDAILMAIADRSRIAAISHYSQDPRSTSIDVALARRFKATSGTAEEVIALSPDLVIAGGHVEPATVAALRRLHVPLLQVGVPATVAESNAQVRTIATALDAAPAGARLVARTEVAVAAARLHGLPVRALIWQGGGLVPGAGTLPDELLRVAGFANASAGYGLRQWDLLPLEPLIARPPRVLFMGEGGSDRMLAHPALRSLRKQVVLRRFPARWLSCGGPAIIDALSALAATRARL